MGAARTLLFIALLLNVILLGINVYSSSRQETFQIPSVQAAQNNATTVLETLLGAEAQERPSPCDHILESQIHVYNDMVVIDIRDAEWAKFTDTNSMDPVIDAGANAIEFVPERPDQICVGDIVSYKSKYAEGTIIHRVVEIGEDQDGWYAILKGDNNPYRDPGKVRFDQVRRVVVAIIY